MELYERLDLDKVNYLNKMDFDEFKLYCNTSCKNDAERKIKYNMLKAFCTAHIKSKGEIRRIYSYTLRTPNEVGGRLYCGNSIQGLSKIIRGFLCKNMTDIDMKAAHPTIARYLCKLYNIDCPNLSYYIENRTQICERFGDEGKTIFLKALNDDKLNKKIKDDFFQKFDKECKMIHSKINQVEEFKHIVDSVPIDKTYNWNGSAFNRIMCVYENKILQEVITLLNSKQIEVGVLMFDGCMIYGDYYKDENLLKEIENAVNNKMEHLNMKFSYKEHDNLIQPSTTLEQYNPETSDDDCYSNIKKQFEKNHAKIINKSLFIIEKEDGELIYHKVSTFKTAYEELKYTDYNSNPPAQKQFITRWLLDEHKRKYEDLQVIPPPLKCPKNIYNLWKPFAISKYDDEYIKDEEALEKFKNHIKILCNHDEIVTDYVIKWFAQMFQYPAIKTVVITFISDEGAGKGTLLDIITSLMGQHKMFVTTQPSRDVWGTFNGLMGSSFFVNLNEMCKREAEQAEGKIKGLITDSDLSISKKGIDSYQIKSYHRFIITTNKEDPVNTSKNDRRNIIIRSSDELLGKIDYFKDLRKSVLSINGLRTIYDYLMSIPNMDSFETIPRPQTEYQKDMKEASRSYYDLWIEDYVRTNQDENELELYGTEQYSLFNQWCKKSNIQFETNSIKMSLAIKRLKINGIETSVKRKLGNATIYNIPLLKKHYMIGNQIETAE
jgi:hypothetical protein